MQSLMHLVGPTSVMVTQLQLGGSSSNLAFVTSSSPMGAPTGITSLAETNSSSFAPILCLCGRGVLLPEAGLEPEPWPATATAPDELLAGAAAPPSMAMACMLTRCLQACACAAALGPRRTHLSLRGDRANQHRLRVAHRSPLLWPARRSTTARRPGHPPTSQL